MLNALVQFGQTTTQTDLTAAEEAGMFAAFSGLMLLLIVLIVLAIVGLWKVFEKAGVDGWKALIPVYNQWLLFEISGKPGWWALVGLAGFIPVLGMFAGLASFVLWVLAALELGKAFGKDMTFTVLGLILFPYVGLLMLGFGDDKYKKPATAPSHVK